MLFRKKEKVNLGAYARRTPPGTNSATTRVSLCKVMRVALVAPIRVTGYIKPIVLMMGLSIW